MTAGKAGLMEVMIRADELARLELGDPRLAQRWRLGIASGVRREGVRPTTLMMAVRII